MAHFFKKNMETDKRVATLTYTVGLLIWVAKQLTSHMFQSNKNKSYRGCSDCLSVSIQGITFELQLPTYQ